MFGVELLVMGGMIAFNSVFAAFEIALASLTLARLHVLATEGRAGARAAAYMKENMEASLAGVQLGITLVGAVAAATGGAGADEQFAPMLQEWFGLTPGTAKLLAIVCVVAPLTFATIIFGELIPKVFALRNKEWVCLKLSPPMKWFVTLVWPVVWALETTVTSLMSWCERLLQGSRGADIRVESHELQELRASVALARTSRLLGAQEEKIILGAAALTTRPVRQAMLPAESISMLHAEQDIAAAMIHAHLDMHTRFPVAEKAGDPQTIVGYVNFKDILAHMRLAPNDPRLQKIIRSIPSLDAESPISACLERLITEHVHIALVRDSGGRVLGMVTMEDLMEELVGDIEDEFDNLPVHVASSGRGWIVGGGLAPERLRAATGIELAASGEDAPRNVNDWICRRLGTVPRGGEVVQSESVRAIVRKIRRNKVLEAQLEAITPRGATDPVLPGPADSR